MRKRILIIVLLLFQGARSQPAGMGWRPDTDLFSEGLFNRLISAGLPAETAARNNDASCLLPDDEMNSLAYEEFSVYQREKQRHIFIILLIAMSIIIVLVFSNLRLKKKEELNRLLLKQQRSRSGSVIASEEKERFRIVYELHEGIGQQLSAAKLNISALHAFLASPNPADKQILKNAADLLDGSVRELRLVSQSLIPNSLVKSGLPAAVREFIKQQDPFTQVHVNLETIGLVDRMEQIKETVLFRMLQEIIGNIFKHARATEVNIQFIRHPKELSILIEDNGAGFDADKVLSTQKSKGLNSVFSRADFLEGSVFFDSRPSRGTTVSIDIPL